MGKTTLQLHVNDRKEHASRLGISLAEFDKLVASANKAYQIIKEHGPFYGREEINEPTFRITAEPVKLPKGSKETLTNLGNDVLKLAKALYRLPDSEKEKLGKGIDFRIPPTWRVDIILDNNDRLYLNEIEGQDGASALMIAEQLAYDLQELSNSTAAKLIHAIKAMGVKQKNGNYKIAYLRVNNPHNTNANRLISYVHTLSNNTLTLDHIFDEDIASGKTKPNWKEYAAVISETSLSPKELYDYGVTEEQLLLAGNYNAIVNKGVFALLHDKKLETFWQKELGKESYKRLKTIMIPTKFIENKEEIDEARMQNKIVKASWAGKDTFIINRSRGIALPVEEDSHGGEDQWTSLKELFDKNVRFIVQDFIIPKKVLAFLRKRETTLEQIEWHNRICVKYVVEGNPRREELPNVTLTAVEVTLGPDVVPAGRKCTFTAGVLQ